MVGIISGALRSIRDKKPTNPLQVSLAGAQNSLDVYKPIYRITITYPITTQVRESVYLKKTITRTIAETTDSLKIMLGLPISDLIGMWIDEDDMQEPDKVVVLLRIDPKITRQTLTDDNPLGDEQLALNKYFSNNHWLDIWLGYKQESISQTIVGTSPTNVLVDKKSLAYPENFDYLSDTHMFSGPIVLINRTIDKHGDRLSVSGFSAERILKDCKMVSRLNENSLYISRFTDKENTVHRSVGQAITFLLESVIIWSDYLVLKKNDLLGSGVFFPLGAFFYAMLEKGFNVIMGWVGQKKYNKHAFRPTDGMINPAVFDKKMQSPISLGGKVSLWDAIQKILSPEVSGSAGVGFRQKKGVYGLDAYDKLMGLGYKEGEWYHPGVYWEFFFTLDVPEAQVFYSRMNDQKKFSGTGLPAKMFQNVILGQDVVDFETWIDSMGTFNSFQIMTSRVVTDPKASPAMAKKKVPVKIPLEWDEASEAWFSTSELDEIKGSDDYNHPQVLNFWRAVYDDIMVYGEREFPITKWIGIDIDKLIINDDLAPELKAVLERDATTSTKHLLKSGLAFTAMFKRYFYAGLEGNAYCVGNPRLAVRRFVHFRDVRNAFNAPKASFDGLSVLDKFHDRLTQMIGPSELDKLDDPENRITNFQSGVNELFYIWKVRHYLGAKSGYLTKVYFTKNRNRAFRETTRDISGVLRNAQRNRQEFIP